jgi:bacillolysin
MKKIISIIFFGGLMIGERSYSQNTFIEKYLMEGSYVFNDALKVRLVDLFDNYKGEFGLSDYDEMVVRHNIVKEDGSFFAIYDLYYKGVLVEGSSMNVIGNKGIVKYVSGFTLTGLDLDITAIISESDALNSAIEYVGATKYHWENEELRDMITEDGGDPDETLKPDISLVFAKSRDNLPQVTENYRLCYKIVIEAIDPAEMITVYVDAKGGSVFTTENGTYDDYLSHYARVVTPHDGVRNDLTTSSCNLCINYKLYDNIIRNITTIPWGLEVTRKYAVADGNNNWEESSKTTAAAAQWSVQKAWDYYFLRHGRPGSDYGKKHVVIYTKVPSGHVGGNANYVPTTNFDNIRLRSDNGNSAAALDILAHEYTHAMINQSSGLGQNTSYVQSCAISEGFADIFGMRIKGFVNGGNYDWKFGESQGYIRHFDNPHYDLAYPSPDRYLDPGYYIDSYNARHRN